MRDGQCASLSRAFTLAGHFARRRHGSLSGRGGANDSNGTGVPADRRRPVLSVHLAATFHIDYQF